MGENSKEEGLVNRVECPSEVGDEHITAMFGLGG